MLNDERFVILVKRGEINSVTCARYLKVSNSRIHDNRVSIMTCVSDT